MEESAQAQSAAEVRTNVIEVESSNAADSSLQKTDDISTRAAQAESPDDVRKLTEEFFARAPAAATQEQSGTEAAGDTDEKAKDEGEEAGDSAATETESAATESAEETSAEGKESEGGEDGKDKDADADEGDEPKSKQYRLHLPANDQVGARAILIQKRNRDLTMEECLARAKEQLGIKAETAAKETKGEDGKEAASESKAAVKLPDTQEATDALIKQLRGERTKALTEEIDFTKADALDAQIDALKDHRYTLRDRAAVEQKDAERTYNEQFEGSKVKAVDLYDFVKDPKSAGALRMQEIDAELEKSGDPLFHSPDKPLTIAQMAARELRIAPRKPGAAKAATTAAKPNVEKKASVLASGAQRTVAQTTQSGQQQAAIQSLKTPQDVEEYLRKSGISMI